MRGLYSYREMGLSPSQNVIVLIIRCSLHRRMSVYISWSITQVLVLNFKAYMGGTLLIRLADPRLLLAPEMAEEFRIVPDGPYNSLRTGQWTN